MNHVSIVMAYYENAGMLARQLEMMETYPKEFRRHLEYLVVDDGSPTAPARRPASSSVSLSIYRMRKDIRWNQDAARNLGVARSSYDFLLLTDMDHLIPPETIESVLRLKMDGRTVFRFSRVSAPDMAPYKPHPNSWFMTRKQWDTIGGYDEALTGYYGTDGDFLSRTQKRFKTAHLKAPLIRVPREVIPDASTTTLTRKDPEDKVAIKAIKNQRQMGWRPLTLSQEWDQVT